MLADADTTEDAVLGGRLVLRQPRRGHRFGHDAILLAAAVDARAGRDRGRSRRRRRGRGARARAARAGARRALVEIDATLAELARENAARNRLADRVSVADAGRRGGRAARSPRPGLRRSVDHVLMNPPFNDPARQNVSPDAARRLAHVGASRRARRDGSIARAALLAAARDPHADLARRRAWPTCSARSRVSAASRSCRSIRSRTPRRSASWSAPSGAAARRSRCSRRSMLNDADGKPSAQAEADPARRHAAADDGLEPPARKNICPDNG